MSSLSQKVEHRRRFDGTLSAGTQDGARQVSFFARYKIGFRELTAGGTQVGEHSAWTGWIRRRDLRDGRCTGQGQGRMEVQEGGRIRCQPESTAEPEQATQDLSRGHR